FIQTLKTCLTVLGIDLLKFSGHSFHCSAASSAAITGFSDYEIQLLGCWHSDAYKLYID
ncbi:uncharacterized protein BT62DRAFT_873964, partial [Guyanagaster necrorhizus]